MQKSEALPSDREYERLYKRQLREPSWAIVCFQSHHIEVYTINFINNDHKIDNYNFFCYPCNRL
jgi:hypothetical protein